MQQRRSTRTAASATSSSPSVTISNTPDEISEKDETLAATSSRSGRICYIKVYNESFEENRYFVWLDKCRKTPPLEANKGFGTELTTPRINGEVARKGDEIVAEKTGRLAKEVPERVQKVENDGGFGDLGVGSGDEIESSKRNVLGPDEIRTLDCDIVNGNNSSDVNKEGETREVSNEAEIESPEDIVRTPNFDVNGVSSNNADEKDKITWVVREKVVTKGPERLKRVAKKVTKRVKKGENDEEFRAVIEAEIESLKHNDSDSNEFQTLECAIFNCVNTSTDNEEGTAREVSNEAEIENPKHIVTASNEFRTLNCDTVDDVNTNNANKEDKATGVVREIVVTKGTKRVNRKENDREPGRVGVNDEADVRRANMIEIQNLGSDIAYSSAKYDIDASIDTNAGKEEKMEKVVRKKLVRKGLKRLQKEEWGEEFRKGEVNNEARTESPNVSVMGAIEFETLNSDVANWSASVSMETDHDTGLVAAEDVNVNANAKEVEKTTRVVRKKIVRVVRKKVVTKGSKRVKKEQPDEELAEVGMLNEVQHENVIELGTPNSDLANSCAFEQPSSDFVVPVESQKSKTEHDSSVVVAVENVNTNACKKENYSGIVTSVEADLFKDPDVAKGEGNNCVNVGLTDLPDVDQMDFENNEEEQKVGSEGSEEAEGAKCEQESRNVSGVKRDTMMADDMVLCHEMEALERRKRRKTEIFIGGLNKDAVEEDVREVFQEVGEIAEMTVTMNEKTGKNKGFAFVRYASAADAKKAVETLGIVEIRGKQCNTSFVKGNDTIFLGNIDKRWRNEDILKLLQNIGVEKIDKVTVKPDPENPKRNRGFAFLEIQTVRGARAAFSLLEKKGFLGNQKIRVEWANEADEEEMHQVKTVYAEYLPASWDEVKVKDHFKKFGDIENVVLARNLISSGRKDFAFVNYKTREAALTCIREFTQDSLHNEGSKVHVNVSLAKSTPKAKQVKHASNPIIIISNKEKSKAAQTFVLPSRLRSKGESTRHYCDDSGVVIQTNQLRSKGESTSDQYDNSLVRASTNDELVQLLREQASWKQPQTSLTLGSANLNYTHSFPVKNHQVSHLRDDPIYSDPRRYPRPLTETAFPAVNPSAMSPALGMQSLPHYHLRGLSYPSGLPYEVDGYFDRSLTRGGAHSGGGSGVYHRY